ncbi:MAG: hypothetical protein KAV87_68645 [Desulfobacteraceae bacterium]|nr:hypothetical protein [Desulfobacteraceae bacterium]
MSKKNIKLHQACVSKDLLLQDIARLAGIERTRFSKILHGSLQATVEEKRNLSTVLGVPQKYLF